MVLIMVLGMLYISYVQVFILIPVTCVFEPLGKRAQQSNYVEVSYLLLVLIALSSSGTLLIDPKNFLPLQMELHCRILR